MIISRTPYRISFFGGGTDYPEWYREHGGAVLSSTIDKYCYLTCRYLPPFFEHRYRVVYSIIETCANVEEIKHPTVRSILQYLNTYRSLEVHHDGDLPAWSGVGSSSSFAVGLLHALHGLEGHMCSKEQLAKEAIHVEQKLVRDVVGSQDQTIAAYGGLKHITFHPTGEISVAPVMISKERLQELKDHLLLFYTGQSRHSSKIASSYVTNIQEKKSQFQFYKEILQEALQILNSQTDISDFGHLFHQGWLNKKSLSSKVSTNLIDEMYEHARKRGALGGKLLGAGGGGFLLLFAKPENHEAILQSLAGILHVPFDFEHQGSSIIYYQPEIDYSAIEAKHNLIRDTLNNLHLYGLSQKSKARSHLTNGLHPWLSRLFPKKGKTI